MRALCRDCSANVQSNVVSLKNEGKVVEAAMLLLLLVSVSQIGVVVTDRRQ